MSNQKLIQLYQLLGNEHPLNGLYLSHDLRQFVRDKNQAFVYSNFIASIDGRIAVPHPTKPGLEVPKAIANERDWRLFQELAAQADIIITSGRYLRDYADGRAQEILQIDDPRFADLRQWRLDHGLSPQPDLAIISASLNFPIPEVLTAGGRNIVVFTTAQADPFRVAQIESSTGKVIVAGEQSVDGQVMVQRMAEMGYHMVYSATGPKVMHLLLSAGVLNRLYLTHANRLLAGNPFSTIVDGELFPTAVDLKINTIYLDPHALDGLGQLLVSYDIQPTP